jgi:cytochrome c553
MMRSTLAARISVAAVLAAFVTATHAADLAAGQAKAQQICQACHGLDGNSAAADYPKLGGQYADYLAKALRDYKSGARKNPIMAGFAGALTPKDIEDVSAYYASQPPVLLRKY